MKISGFRPKLLYAVAYVPPLAHTRVRGGSLPLSEGPPSWRPSARLTTERYVKDQVPQLPAERLNCIKSALALTSAILGARGSRVSRHSRVTSGAFGERALPTTAEFDGRNENQMRKFLERF